MHEDRPVIHSMENFHVKLAFHLVDVVCKVKRTRICTPGGWESFMREPDACHIF